MNVIERSAFMEYEKKISGENFAVRTPQEFLQSFEMQAQRAFISAPNRDYNLSLPEDERPRMGLQAMLVEFYGKEPRVIYDSLLEAAQKGFNVEIHRDWYSETIRDEDFLFFPPTVLVGKDRRDHRLWVSGFTAKRREILEKAGVNFVDTNPPKNKIEMATTFLKGRNHKKITFIVHPDGMAAWIGGMNIARIHFDMLDYMVEITDSRIIMPIIDEFSRVNENRRTKSVEVPCTEDTSILVDTGRDESVINKMAVEMIDNGRESVYMMSALHPEGEVLEALKRARNRGVHSAYITVEPKVAGLLWGGQSIFADKKASIMGKRIPLLYPKDKTVHGKALVVDESKVITGSSNFTPVKHEELSLYSKNPTLVRNVVNFMNTTFGVDNLTRQIAQDTVFDLPLSVKKN